MKKILEKILNFIKQYPFTFLFICLFIWINIIHFMSYINVNNMIPSGYAFISLILPVIFGLVIFLFIKVFGDRNRFVKGIILFFINVFFLYANSYVSDECWLAFCRTLKNPDTYGKIVSGGNFYPVSWKQFGDGFYLNTDFICYYKDEENNHHAVITLKLPKGEIDGEPFEYMYAVSDMNLTQKTYTSLHAVFFNNGHKIHSDALDKTNPKNTRSISTNSRIGRVYQYLMSQAQK